MSAEPLPPVTIEIIEPDPDDCLTISVPPEGNVKLRNYRMLNDNLRAYTPTGDIHTSPTKGKLVSRYDVTSEISPPRARILELVRAEDPGREALEAIVRPAPRRGLARPLDEDTRRFLQRTLLSPSPQGFSNAVTPEPYPDSTESSEQEEGIDDSDRSDSSDIKEEAQKPSLNSERSLADELREAEECERSGTGRVQLLMEAEQCGREEQARSDTVERERLGRLALAVEEDEGGLEATARRLDALLAESRRLQCDLVAIHQDMKAECARAVRCAAAARALGAESQRLRYLDDVVALLRGDVGSAVRAKAWPFVIAPREPHRNYII